MTRISIRFNKEVKSLVHQYMFEASTREIEEVLKRSEHALGDLDSEKDPLPEVENFDTPFALQYFFHAMLEENKSVPTFEQFWEAMRTKFRPYYLEELARRLKFTSYSKEEKYRAARWRLGKSYYSNLRELYLFASLREKYGVNLKYHLFADLVLAIDGWLGNKILYIRVPNNYEKRKRKPVRGFNIIRVDIHHQGFGTLWKPTESQIAKIAQAFL